MLSYLNLYILKSPFLLHVIIFKIWDRKAAGLIVSLLYLENWGPNNNGNIVLL